MALVQSVPDDEIDAELAAALSIDDHELRDSIEQRAKLATVAARAVGTAPHPLRPLQRRRDGDPRDLREATERVRPASLAHEHTLPLSGGLEALLPAGLARGTTVSVGEPSPSAGSGATSLALALASAATQAGSWAALVGLPAVGLGAAAELGLALERVAVIDTPPRESWATVVGALVGAFDLVLFGAPGRSSAVPVGAADLRRLMARARERGSVLIQIDTAAASRSAGGAVDRGRRSSWSAFEAEVRLSVTSAHWVGLGEGHGHVRGRQVRAEATGRRSAARVRRVDLWLPRADGQVTAVTAHELIRAAECPPVSEAPAYAGADIDELVPALDRARRDRIRRVATAPLADGGPPAPPAEPVWSDAG